MSSNVKDVLQAPIIRFDTVDSTNNRAAQMIDADKSVEGLTIIAQQQTAGKGQRGNRWSDEPAQALLMSIVIEPKVPIEAQFSFSAAVAVALAEVLQELDSRLEVRIKFPNDIIVNDKKAAGILIENALRGSQWTHAIIGTGINVHQRSFNHLPQATSLFLATQQDVDIEALMTRIRERVICYTKDDDLELYIKYYNDLLYKTGKRQSFSENGTVFEALICGVTAQGALQLQMQDGERKNYVHGVLNWQW